MDSGTGRGTVDGEAAAAGFRVRCDTATSDTLLRVAGVEFAQVTNWLVADGVVIGAKSVDDVAEVSTFDGAFREWLSDNGPVGINYLDNASNLSELLLFLDRFVAHSDDYPIPSDEP